MGGKSDFKENPKSELDLDLGWKGTILDCRHCRRGNSKIQLTQPSARVRLRLGLSSATYKSKVANLCWFTLVKF